MNQTIDYKIWSRTAPDDDWRLPKISDCRLELIEKREAEMGEIPADILLSVGGITSFVHFRLSEYESENSIVYARKFAHKTAKELDGAVEETGMETVYCTEKQIPPALNEYTPMLTLSVWFDNDKSFSSLFEDIVALFEKEMPFALPSRFGEKMPPDREYTDRAEFIEFLKNTPAPVWYARKPVTHVHINDCERADAKRDDLRVNRLSICMPDELYETEEWKFALRRLLKSLTTLTGAFFGQICRGDSGVVSWWWRGIPLELGVACTFGEPYYSLIPDASENGEKFTQGYAYFEEPNGPYVPIELVSSPKKRFGSGRRLYPDDFTVAANMPIGKK